jgi:hypothetical protein
MRTRNNLLRLLALTALPALLFSACSLAASEPAEPAGVEAAAPSSDAPQPDSELSAAPLDPENAAEASESGGEDQPAEASADQVPPEQAAPTEAPAESSSAALGPDQYPEGINPLTGLPVSDPSVLQDCPLLVAVSNFPPSSRRSLSGLSVASQVWETFIGEGMTRYLAVFYGDYAEQLNGILANPLVDGSNFAIGPVRSGRVAFEDIKMLFPGATLVTAGASPEVAEQLTGVQTAYGSDPENISSAGLEASELGGLPCRHGKPPSLAGLAFDPASPAGGDSAEFCGSSTTPSIRWAGVRPGPGVLPAVAGQGRRHRHALPHPGELDRRAAGLRERAGVVRQPPLRQAHDYRDQPDVCG